MRLVKPATVFNSSLLQPPYVGVTAYSVSAFFAVFFSFHIGVHVILIWTSPEQPSSHKKMRLAEPATVSNSSLLKPPYVGVTAYSVIRLLFTFLSYQLTQPFPGASFWT